MQCWSACWKPEKPARYPGGFRQSFSIQGRKRWRPSRQPASLEPRVRSSVLSLEAAPQPQATLYGKRALDTVPSSRRITPRNFCVSTGCGDRVEWRARDALACQCGVDYAIVALRESSSTPACELGGGARKPPPARHPAPSEPRDGSADAERSLLRACSPNRCRRRP